jgi:hypothetical protein
MTDVTQLLSALGQGDPHAASRLLPLVYDELIPSERPTSYTGSTVHAVSTGRHAIGAAMRIYCVSPVTIDYGPNLGAMIAAGGYDWVDSDLTAEHFPISGEAKVAAQLVLVGANLGQMLGEEPGVQPARLEHLLAYGAQHWQKAEGPVLALGSTWEKLVTASVPSPTGGSSSAWLEVDKPIPSFTTRTLSLGRLIPCLSPGPERGRGLDLIDIRYWEMDSDEYIKLVGLEEHVVS